MQFLKYCLDVCCYTVFKCVLVASHFNKSYLTQCLTDNRLINIMSYMNVY